VWPTLGSRTAKEENTRHPKENSWQSQSIWFLRVRQTFCRWTDSIKVLQGQYRSYCPGQRTHQYDS